MPPWTTAPASSARSCSRSTNRNSLRRPTARIIDQDVHRLWAPFFATAVGETGLQDSVRAWAIPSAWAFEYLDGDHVPSRFKIAGANTGYRFSYDMVQDARDAGRQLQAKLKARSVEPGKYDLVLDPHHLMLTIHESVGHPLELDRVLGYEANYAGTSFATLDKWQ